MREEHTILENHVVSFFIVDINNIIKREQRDTIVALD